MKLFVPRVVLLFIGLASSAALAQAHPGHEGHELTWDARHLASHPLATIGCVVVLAGGAVLAARGFRALRDARAERVSTRR